MEKISALDTKREQQTNNEKWVEKERKPLFKAERQMQMLANEWIKGKKDSGAQAK